MSLAWNESFRIGLPTIDKQHQELIRQVQELHEAMKQGKARDHIGKMLQFLASYTQQHFADEERAMEQYQCPAAEANKAAHRQLLAKLGELRAEWDCQKTGATVSTEIYRTLSTWLVAHIQGIDLQLRECLSTATVSS